MERYLLKLQMFTGIFDGQFELLLVWFQTRDFVVAGTSEFDNDCSAPIVIGQVTWNSWSFGSGPCANSPQVPGAIPRPSSGLRELAKRVAGDGPIV